MKLMTPDVDDEPPRVGRSRLGWCHHIMRRALLAGVSSADDAHAPGEPPPALRPLVEIVEEYRQPYVHAAHYLAAEYRGGYSAMYLVSPILVWCGVASTHGPLQSRLLSGIEFLLIFFILILFLVMRRSRWQTRWVNARRTAEHLRYLPLIAPFVRNPESNWYDDVAHRFGQRLINEPAISRICRSLAGRFPIESIRLDDPVLATQFRTYVDEILTAQISYHASKAKSEHELGRRISLASFAFFGATIVCTALLFFENFNNAPFLPSATTLRDLATVLPAIGAGLRGLLAQSESHQVATLSEGMSARLGQLQRELRGLPESGANENVAVTVWNAVLEMLSEADTWLKLQESVPLTPGG